MVLAALAPHARLQATMTTVHHLENSRSQRILWLLEEMGLDYEIRFYARDRQTGLAPPELVKVHPLGKSPVITDDGVTVAESGAIIEFLLDKYDDGTLWPPAGSAARRACTYWLHYAEGSFAPLMLVSLLMDRIETAPVPFFIKPVAKGLAAKVRSSYLDHNVRRNLDFMESTLSSSRWFAGEKFSAADIQMSFALDAAESRTSLREDYPQLSAFLDRSRSRPAYQAAISKGGEYQLARISKPV
jgi:glutathione S-transferase